MRADLAPIGVTAMYLFAGIGVLAAARMVRPTAAGVLAITGLAYMAGVAAVLLVGIALMSAGVALSAPHLLLVAFVIGVTGLASALWQGGRLRRPQKIGGRPDVRGWRGKLADWDVEHWMAAAFVVGIAGYAVVGYASTITEPLAQWDAWSIWGRKALLLVEYGKPTAAFFDSHHYVFMIPDYPMLVPLFEATFFRLAGATDFEALHGQFWILFIAALWAFGYLASRVARPLAWSPLVALLAVTPALHGGVRTLYADVPMSLFLGLGVLLVGLWLTSRRTGDLLVGALLLAAAANTKNEGLAAAMAVLLVAAVVAGVVARKAGVRRSLAPLLAAIAGVALLVAPWRLWTGANALPGYIPVRKGFDPSFLLDHADRIWPTVAAIGGQVSDQSNWYYLLPLALAVAIVALSLPDQRRLAAFYAGTGLAVFVSIVIWGYVVNPNQLDWLFGTTIDRTVDAIMLVAAAGLLHLVGALMPAPLSGEQPETAPEPEPVSDASR
jgi:hypothetical protein